MTQKKTSEDKQKKITSGNKINKQTIISKQCHSVTISMRTLQSRNQFYFDGLMLML